MLNNKFNNINVVLILLSISLIVPKWIFSYYLFPNEDLLFKILSETKSIAYYPLINNLSDFNLSPLYDPNIKDIRGIFGFPIMNLIILSFFWKIFGPLGFILIELICVFVFFKIFCNLIRYYISEKSIIIFFGIFLFSLTFYFEYLNILEITPLTIFEINFSNFYGLRFPRPIISNLFLFSYIYFCHLIFVQNKGELKNYIFLGILSGFTAHIFYFFFIIQNMFLAILFFFKIDRSY